MFIFKYAENSLMGILVNKKLDDTGSLKIELFPGAHSIPSNMVRINSGGKSVFYTVFTRI